MVHSKPLAILKYHVALACFQSLRGDIAADEAGRHVEGAIRRALMAGVPRADVELVANAAAAEGMLSGRLPAISTRGGTA